VANKWNISCDVNTWGISLYAPSYLIFWNFSGMLNVTSCKSFIHFETLQMDQDLRR
jgi:hypothetical protein